MDLLSILMLIVVMNICYCNLNVTEDNFFCSQLDRSRKLRAFILSGQGFDERYQSTRTAFLNIGFNVIRYKPPGITNPRWDEIYKNIIGEEEFHKIRHKRTLRRLKTFLVSQAWLEMAESAYPYSLRSRNKYNQFWLSGYTFFFEDDFGLNKGMQDPYCAIVTAMNINPPSGVLFMGMENTVCHDSIVLNGFSYGTECFGSGAHALGLRNSIAPSLTAAVRVIQGDGPTDMSLFQFSRLYNQSFMLIGSDLHSGSGFRGMFFQDRARFPSNRLSNETF